MNLKCLICSDLFTPSADIHVTPCGHMFHYPCLTQWLDRSRTCPQCRQNATETSIHRVFLSVEENSEPIDINTLQNKLDNLQFEIRVKENQVKKANEKFHTIEAENVVLRDKVKHLETKSRGLASALITVKEHLGCYKNREMVIDDLESQIKGLKEKLKEMEYLNLVTNGSEQQVNDMLRDNNDPQFLVVLLTSLKKELIDSDKNKKEIQGLLEQTKNKCANYNTELAELNLQIRKLRSSFNYMFSKYSVENKCLKKKLQELELESYKTDLNTTSLKKELIDSDKKKKEILELVEQIKHKCANYKTESEELNLQTSKLRFSFHRIVSIYAMENKYLKKKLQEHELDSNKADLDTTIKSVVAESPIPLPNIDIDVNRESGSPSFPEIVQSIKEVDSPFLKVQSSSVELSGALNCNTKFIAKPTRDKTFPMFKTPDDYEGLGGHSKNDEFPTPQSNKQGIKRSGSLSVAALTKQIKLEPVLHNKLD